MTFFHLGCSTSDANRAHLQAPESQGFAVAHFTRSRGGEKNLPDPGKVYLGATFLADQASRPVSLNGAIPGIFAGV
jgi:hypothetical protein